MSDTIDTSQIDTPALQFSTIFRNQFGVLPEDLGLVVSGYSASGNGHTVALDVVNGKIQSGWHVDGALVIQHRILDRDTHQAQRLEQLKAKLN